MKGDLKMKKIEEERGITLVALIITVIILVILAAVSIRSVYEAGIVGHAINGSKQYVRQGKVENEMIERTSNTIESTLKKLEKLQGKSSNNETETQYALLVGDVGISEYTAEQILEAHKIWIETIYQYECYFYDESTGKYYNEAYDTETGEFHTEDLDNIEGLPGQITCSDFLGGVEDPYGCTMSIPFGNGLIVQVKSWVETDTDSGESKIVTWWDPVIVTLNGQTLSSTFVTSGGREVDISDLTKRMIWQIDPDYFEVMMMIQAEPTKDHMGD